MTNQAQTVGEILKKAREELKLDLEEISVQTRIREKYLAAIEADRYEALPSSVQVKGFVRAYARALGLDEAPLLNQLRLALDVEEEKPETEEPSDVSLAADTGETQPLGEIGGVIRTQRERLGFTIPSVESQIFVPERYLIAIENGNLEELPSTVQGKGMLKNYAQFLGLDPEPLLSRYADVLQERLNQRKPEEPAVKKAPSHFRARIRRMLASPNILWAGVVLLISIVSVWSGWLIFGNREQEIESTATIPAVAEILLPSPTATELAITPDGTPGEIEVDISPTPQDEGGDQELVQTPTPALTGNEKIQVQLITIQRAWVRVTVDNIIAFEGRLLPGSVKLFGGELSIEVLTGNAGGVEVIYNQQDLGAMGLYGEVINRIYTPDGVATPTPTISPTPVPSETPTPSITPTATAESES